MCSSFAADRLRICPSKVLPLANISNVIDSFDTHANIPAYFADMDAALKSSGKVGIISVGWDPGLFSQPSVYELRTAAGKSYTFWGKGVSQGIQTPFAA